MSKVEARIIFNIDAALFIFGENYYGGKIKLDVLFKDTN